MKKQLFALALALAFSTLSARAEYIVNTGPSLPKYDAYAFADWQYFGGQFDIEHAHTIRSIETRVQTHRPVVVTVGISTDQGDRPGNEVFRQDIVARPTGFAFSWLGAFDMDVLLQPGTYWITFQPQADVGAAISGRASTSLEEYSQGMYGRWHPVPLNNYDALMLEMRVDGEREPDSPVPEPAHAIFASLLALAATRRGVRSE